MKKKICLLVLFIIVGFGIYYYFSNKEDTLKNEYRDAIAIYIGENGSYSKYKEIPTSGYTLNLSKSNCVDLNGAEVSKDGLLSYSEQTGLTINTNSALYCDLYFDKR